MALDIQIPYRGDQYLFQGISGGAHALAQGAEQMTDRFRRIQDAGKAADYFMKAGGDEMYAQAGIHPDEWKTLGARDKAAAVQAIMEKGTMARMAAQTQDIASQAKEREQMGAAREQQSQLAGEEAAAFPQLMQTIMENRQRRAAQPGPDMGASADAGGEMGPVAPGGGAPAGPMPPTPTTGTSGNFSPEEIMAGMAAMGKTSPRLAAALSRTLIPKMMEGGMQGPQSYQSPGGNPYVWMGHTLMPDRAGFDPSAMMGSVPTGYQVMPDGRGGVKVLPEKKAIDAPAQLPAAFYSKLDKLSGDLKDATRRAGYSDAEAKKFLTGSQETPEQYRQRMGKARDVAQREIQDHLKMFESEGYGKPETWQMLRQKYQAAGGAAAAGAAAAGTGDKVMVKKDGKKFMLPRAQLEAAKKQGYTEAK